MFYLRGATAGHLPLIAGWWSPWPYQSEGFNPHLIADVKCAAALPTHLEPRAFRHIFFGLAVSCAYVR